MKFWQSDTTVLNYVPIIVAGICNGGYSIVVTESSIHLDKGDILLTSADHKAGSWKMHVNEVSYINDIFEDYIILEISAVTNTDTLWMVKDFVKVGDELKLLGNAARES
jgi:hypothetical protein